MIRFGAWSVFLLVFALQALALAAALFRSRANRLANRILALLLIVVAGLLTPFILGYAGFYDSYPWLSYAPFAVPLAIGPLVHGHILALTRQHRLPWAHFLLPALQFLYQLALFPLPLATKDWFDSAVQTPYLGPLLAVLVPASMLFYVFHARREARAYRAWLAERRRDPAPARRLRAALAFLALLAAARIAVALIDTLVAPLDYFDLFAFYVLLAVASSWLGIEGLRRAEAPAPPQVERPERDWAAQGREWLARIEAEGWWRDPEADVANLSRRLGTNAGSLSRAVNAAEGSIGAVLARMRCEHVAARLKGGERGDLLALAFEAGFGSKASFNRLFRARFRVTPSAYRAKVSNPE
ncbi:MAG TPA: helix-turn-helix domain-containing protein [Allosphingosinicella sp.]|nr:helix-turn-helix domain-containing protein [Allosphingosinicella sp.]